MIPEYHVRILTATNLARKNHMVSNTRPHGFAKAGIGSYILNIPLYIATRNAWQNEKGAVLSVSSHSMLEIKKTDGVTGQNIVTSVLQRGTRTSPSTYVRIPHEVIVKLGWILNQEIVMVANDASIVCQRWQDIKRLFRWLVKTGGEHDRRTLVKNAYRDIWLGKENFEHLLRQEQEARYLQKIARLRSEAS